MADLKKATRTALLWSALEKTGQQGIFMVVAIFTGRLLTPEEFGIVGSLSIFVAVSNILLESGFSLALIRRQDATQDDYNTVFYFNLGVSLVLYLLLFFGAPLIARFYGQPEMTALVRVLAFSCIIYAFGIIQSTLLIKRMDFRRLTAANLSAFFCSGAVSVTMAFTGYGVWALIAQNVVMAGVKTGMLWLLCRWKPRRIFSWASFRGMFPFSSRLLAGNLVNTFSNYFYSFILGRFFPMQQVGYYVQAGKMKDAGSSVVWSAFGTSTYTMLSSLQDDKPRLKRAMRKTVRTAAFVAFPVMLGIAVVAPPVIEILITDRWLPAVPFVRWLSVGAIFFILSQMNGNFIKVAGRSGAILKMELLNAFLLVSFLFLTVRFGLLAAVASDAVSKAIVYACYAGLNSRLTGYRWSEQLRDIAPYAGIAMLMVLAIYPLRYVIPNPYLLLAAQLVGGMVVYGGISKATGSVILDEVLEALFRRFRRKPGSERG